MKRKIESIWKTKFPMETSIIHKGKEFLRFNDYDITYAHNFLKGTMDENYEPMNIRVIVVYCGHNLVWKETRDAAGVDTFSITQKKIDNVLEIKHYNTRTNRRETPKIRYLRLDGCSIRDKVRDFLDWGLLDFYAYNQLHVLYVYDENLLFYLRRIFMYKGFAYKEYKNHIKTLNSKNHNAVFSYDMFRPGTKLPKPLAPGRYMELHLDEKLNIEQFFGNEVMEFRTDVGLI